MSSMRDRVKENFPTVLLTLLSIVQAVALELLWSHVLESDFLLQGDFVALLCWIQLVATLLGLLLIWVFYASNTMRFRWVPDTSDSVYPFVIGLMEFLLIELMVPQRIGLWLIAMGVVFGLMVWVSHHIMRRARLDGDNDAFFKDFAPAKFSDFYGHIGAVIALMTVGLYIHLTANTGVIAMLGLLIALAVLVWQFFIAAMLWRRSVAL